MKKIYSLVLLIIAVAYSTGFRAYTKPDPFRLSDSYAVSTIPTGVQGYRTTAGRSIRSQTTNPAQKTLILIGAGQSLIADSVPTLITPANASVIDNINIYDGAIYDVAGPLLGTTWGATVSPPQGPGNTLVRYADQLISAGKFDRVIIASIAIGNTTIAQWGDAGGLYSDRGRVIMARLAAIGITPSSTNTTWACYMAIGNNDFLAGTTQSAFAASANNFFAIMTAAGFNGRFFVPQESGSGQTSNAIRSAQASLWNGTNIFNGGDFDSSTIATSDGTHPSDAGAITQANIAVAAMAASGAPF